MCPLQLVWFSLCLYQQLVYSHVSWFLHGLTFSGCLLFLWSIICLSPWNVSLQSKHSIDLFEFDSTCIFCGIVCLSQHTLSGNLHLHLLKYEQSSIVSCWSRRCFLRFHMAENSVLRCVHLNAVSWTLSILLCVKLTCLFRIICEDAWKSQSWQLNCFLLCTVLIWSLNSLFEMNYFVHKRQILFNSSLQYVTYK